MRISNMIEEYAERIYRKERLKFAESISSVPRHLIE